MQVGEIPLIGVKSTQVMIGFGIELYLIAATGNICEIRPNQLIIPRLVQQSRAIACCIVVHLIGMAHNIKTTQLEHPRQPTIIETDHMLQVTAEMSVYNGLKGIRRYIYIHHFPFVIVEKMYRTNTVVQRQLPETGDGRITRFIQIINLQTDIQFDTSGILLLQTMEFR